jgi:hypothetical protein
MSDSSLLHKTVFRKGFVFIQSDLDIEELGKLISQRLVGGLPFDGLDHYIRDEIPAIYIKDILGCRLILQGFPGEMGYNLVLEEGPFPHQLFEKEGQSPLEVDISGNLYWLLQDLEGISVSLE